MATLQEKYDAGKKAYAASLRANRGQAGGSSSIPSEGKKSAFRELQRQKFFGDRRDIPTERIDRRTRQEGNLRQFKDSLIRNDRVLKDSKGNTVLNTNTGEPIFLSETPGGRNVSDVAKDLAFRFGPTPKEIVGDIGYGLGSIAKGFAEKGTPLISLLRGLYGKGKDFFTQGIPSALKGESQFDTSQARDPFSSGADATGGAFVGPTFNDQKINPNRLDSIFPPSKMDDQTFENEVMKYLSNTNINDYRADNVGLPSLLDLYNFSQNPEIQTNMGNFRFDNVFTGNPQLGYGNTVMINGVPVNLNATIGREGLGLGASMNFKKGGPVDKYSGLGYKLK